ncbi:AI-2E family transporter [Prosthecomicrobium sp. N25]|uniref:AI-2E family transporter n=1 Tax=Prosthecomicrobium sp. N25 TaxID=3129254 RepID=UPI003077BE87
MSLTKQVQFWIAALAVFIAFLYVFSDVLLPFVSGMALAYLLDPLADRLERLGLTRPLATLAIVIGLIVGLTVILILVVPLLVNQIGGFVDRLPYYVTRLQAFGSRAMDGRLGQLVGSNAKDLEAQLGSFLSQGAGWITRVLQSIWNGGQAIMSILTLLVIAPVVAFYLLLDWDRMVDKIDSWLPLRHRETIRGLARDMNAVVAGFVRGQISVCLAMGIFYATGLTLVGLNFGLFIGLLAGILGFIPFVGFGVGLIASVGVAIAQFWPEWQWILAVLAVFFAGQMLEGYVLQPNWVGRSVGLHPVWLLFSLFAFGSMAGFVGMLVAVPVAASVGVLARFALEQYLASPFYAASGSDDPDGASA